MSTTVKQFISLNELIKSTQSLSCFPQILYTAAMTAWFTDGTILTRLTKEEHKICNNLYERNKAKSCFNDVKLLHVDEAIYASLGVQLFFSKRYDAKTKFPYHPSLVFLQSASKITNVL